MTTTTQKTKRPAGGNRPTLRAWLVQDRPDSDKPLWTELTGLWPTKTGTGFSGSVEKAVPYTGGILVGRLVVLPSRFRPDAETDGAEGGDE